MLPWAAVLSVVITGRAAPLLSGLSAPERDGLWRGNGDVAFCPVQALTKGVCTSY